MTDPAKAQTQSGVTREQALALGLTIYTIGKFCKYGHTEGWRVSNRNCVQCNRDNAARRSEKRRSDNDGSKIFTGSPCRFCFGTDRYTVDSHCVECKNRKVRLWQSANARREKIRKKAWSRANAEKLCKKVLERQKKNPLSERVKSQNRRARKNSAEGRHTKQDIDNIFAKQQGRCAYCGVDLGNNYHIDHIIPLSKQGTNWPRNLQLLDAKCNLSKANKDPLDFAREIGLLV